jgi:hypothetical protein
MTEPATALGRPTPMRRTLGTLLATAALAVTAGCGSATSSAASPSAGQPDTPGPGPITGAEVLPLISQTGGGGQVSTHASLLGSRAEVAAFTRQFQVPGLASRVRAAAAEAAQSGHAVYGAVVAFGCDVPPGAVVALDANGEVQITAKEVASPLPECLAPVTTVALATVPGAD